MTVLKLSSSKNHVYSNKQLIAQLFERHEYLFNQENSWKLGIANKCSIDLNILLYVLLQSQFSYPKVTFICTLYIIKCKIPNAKNQNKVKL